MIRALGSSRYSLWSTVIRKEVRPRSAATFSDPFCDLLNKRYMAQLREKRMFTNELYLTIVRSGMRGALGAAESVSRLLDGRPARSVRQRLHERINELEEIVGNIMRGAPEIRRAPARYRPSRGRTVFGTVRVLQHASYLRVSRGCACPAWESETMSEPRGCIFPSGQCRPRGRSRGEPLRRDALDQGVPALLRARHAGWAAAGQPRIHSDPVLHVADKPIAQERISRLQRQIHASDEAGSTVETDIDFALNSCEPGSRIRLPPFQPALPVARSRWPRQGRRRTRRLPHGHEHQLAARGPQHGGLLLGAAARQSHLHRPFRACCPAPISPAFRRCTISRPGRPTATIGALPISILETTSQTPYRFNFHQRDIGHFLVTGPTGSGKTVALDLPARTGISLRPEPRSGVLRQGPRRRDLRPRRRAVPMRCCSPARRPASTRSSWKTTAQPRIPASAP